MDINLSEEEKIKILNSDSLYRILRRILMRENVIDQNREHLWVVGLAQNNKILFIELVSMGSVKATIIEPMEVFSFALQKRAVKIILAHNHPSGELTPSKSDKDVTDQMIQVGKIVNTPVIDHLIITEETFLSFADIGLLDELSKSTKYVPHFLLQLELKAKMKELKEKNNEIKKNKSDLLKSKTRMAKFLHERNEPIEVIMEVTGLTKEEVSKTLKN